MKERTQVRVSPEYEESVAEVYETFGWTLEDAQEIYNENTSITGVDVTTYGDGAVGAFMRGFTGKDGAIRINQHTSVTNYVTLRFSRDTTIYGYRELVEKEQEYFRLLEHKEARKPVKRTGILIAGLIILIISIIYSITEHNPPEIWELMVIGVFLAVMIPFTIIGWKHYVDDSHYDYWAYNRMTELISEARDILENDHITV